MVPRVETAPVMVAMAGVARVKVKTAAMDWAAQARHSALPTSQP